MAVVIDGDFEWDADKAAANVAAHGVSFVEAASVFADENAAVYDDPTHGRLVVIGLSNTARLLLVVHIERGDRVRIISARKASRHEAKLY